MSPNDQIPSSQRAGWWGLLLRQAQLVGRRPVTHRALLAALLSGPLILSGCASSPQGDSSAGPAAKAAPMPKEGEPTGTQRKAGSYVVHGKRYYTKASSDGHVERGEASWYGRKFHGRKTASGERYNMHAMTAAHKSLPLPSYVEVTNLANGRRAVVRVNDRGPFIDGRIIDVSYAAAKRLAMTRSGTAPVEVRAIDPSKPSRRPKARLQLAAASGDDPPVSRSASSGRGASVATAEPLYLQVGAFSDRGNADQLLRQLRTKLEEPVRLRSRASSFTVDQLYRVQIGPLSSRREASRLQRRLAALGIDTPMMVTR